MVHVHGDGVDGDGYVVCFDCLVVFEVVLFVFGDGVVCGCEVGGVVDEGGEFGVVVFVCDLDGCFGVGLYVVFGLVLGEDYYGV